MLESNGPSGPDTRHPHVVNLDRLIAETRASPDERFAVHRKQLGAATGGKKLGCSWVAIPPGKRAWPHHWHWGNEEAMFVLHGRGTLRLGEREIAIAAGDYIACPCSPAGAHQLYNDSAEPLECLIVSTMEEPDVTVYPDSNKIGVYAGSAPGGPDAERTMSMILPTAAAVEYWVGEGEAST